LFKDVKSAMEAARLSGERSESFLKIRSAANSSGGQSFVNIGHPREVRGKNSGGTSVPLGPPPRRRLL